MKSTVCPTRYVCRSVVSVSLTSPPAQCRTGCDFAGDDRGEGRGLGRGEGRGLGVGEGRATAGVGEGLLATGCLEPFVWKRASAAALPPTTISAATAPKTSPREPRTR